MQQENSSISNFKVFALRLFLPLLLVVSVALAIFTYFFENEIILKTEISGAYKINKILSAEETVAIPILGSSRVEGGIIPDMIGGSHPYFNYGLSGIQEDVILTLLEGECAKPTPSPWVIVNYDLEGINSSIGDIAYYLYNSTDPSIAELLGDRLKVKHKIPSIKYYGYFEYYLKLFINQKTQTTKYINKGAYVEKKFSLRKGLTGPC